MTFARRAYELGLGVFDETDLRRFAATYAKQILAGERSSNLVDGTNRQGRYDRMTAVGLPLAKWEPSIRERVLKLYAAEPSAGAPQGRLVGTAYFNLDARQRR